MCLIAFGVYPVISVLKLKCVCDIDFELIDFAKLD